MPKAIMSRFQLMHKYEKLFKGCVVKQFHFELDHHLLQESNHAGSANLILPTILNT
jgi:hypothetical protein